MSIRRKSTAHDLATLRLHPDGSRVQQSSVNTKRRTAGSTAVDPRGNWIAKDAGGKSSVKKRRNIHIGGEDGGFVCLTSNVNEEDVRRRRKGKQRAGDTRAPEEESIQDLALEQLNTRARRRVSFIRDFSFLDPPLLSVSTLGQDTDHSDTSSAGGPVISFPDPAPDLLKSIHHFTSCYYRERGQLIGRSKSYRGKKKERCKRSPENIHSLAANPVKHQNIDSETEHTESEDETHEDDENESEVVDAEEGEAKGPRTELDTYVKDMYKAFDGSALMAIGIVLQEYVAHTLSSRPRT